MIVNLPTEAETQAGKFAVANEQASRAPPYEY
jgi:hypothetical protein